MSRHYSQLYRQLRDLDPHDYHRVIRYYEEAEADIGRLDVLENFELTAYYVDALYATGEYRQHQLMVDLVIQNSIVHNLNEVAGVSRDIYQYMLFRKAAAAYRLRDFPVATHVGRELIRIDPTRQLYRKFLRVTLFKQQTRLLQIGRAAFIASILCTAGLILLNLIWIRNFLPEYVPRVNLAVAISFATGLSLLAGAYGTAYLRAHRAAYGFQQKQANKPWRKRLD